MKSSSSNRGLYFLFSIQSIFWLSTSILTPFLSIFLINEYTGVGLTEFGISNLIYFLAFGLLLPIIGKFEDQTKGMMDELILLNWGLISRGILFILLSLANGVWTLYILQLFFGFSRAIFSPSYKSLLLKYSNKNNGTSYIFSMDESLVNIFAAIGSGLGGYFATVFGPRVVIFVVGMLFISITLLSFPVVKSLKIKHLLKK